MCYSGSSGEGVTLIYSISRNKRAKTIEFVANRKIFLLWVFRYLFFSFQIMEYNQERKPFTFYLISQRIRRHSCKEFTQLMETLTSIKYSVITTKSCENSAWYIWITKIITSFTLKIGTFNCKILIFLMVFFLLSEYILKVYNNLQTPERVVKHCLEWNQVGTQFTCPFIKCFLICNKP